MFRSTGKKIPDFLDVLDELLAVLLPLVPVLRHHQLAAAAGLPRCRRRRVLRLISVSSAAPSACIIITIVLVSRNISTRITL
jgi:hypothetical protein